MLRKSREVKLRPSPLETSPSIREPLKLVARGTATSDGVNSLCCPDCEFPLELHQPDLGQPMQLLGTCGGCSKWFFIVDLDFDGTETVLLELPSAELIRLEYVAARLS
jgi:hypothetical protein